MRKFELKDFLFHGFIPKPLNLSACFRQRAMRDEEPAPPKVPQSRSLESCSQADDSACSQRTLGMTALYFRDRYCCCSLQRHYINNCSCDFPSAARARLRSSL